MTTIMRDDELVRRALAFAEERLQELKSEGRTRERELSALLDEAGARFNLSPARSARLTALLERVVKGKTPE